MHTITITEHPHPRTFTACCSCGHPLGRIVLAAQDHLTEMGLIPLGAGHGRVVDAIAGDTLTKA